MRDLNFNRKLLRFFRENPLQILGVGFFAFFIFCAIAIGLVLPHPVKGHAATTLASLNGADAESTLAPVPGEGAATRAVLSYSQVVREVAPTVVTIHSDIKTQANQASGLPFMNDPMFRQFFNGRIPSAPTPQVEHALGSGVIVESNGTILTNNHVVAGASKIRVDLPDKRSFEAKVVGTDAASDLAVLHVAATNLPALRFGDSDQVQVGDVVLAVGYPLGLQQTVTSSTLR